MYIIYVGHIYICGSVGCAWAWDLGAWHTLAWCMLHAALHSAAVGVGGISEAEYAPDGAMDVSALTGAWVYFKARPSPHARARAHTRRSRAHTHRLQPSPAGRHRPIR